MRSVKLNLVGYGRTTSGCSGWADNDDPKWNGIPAGREHYSAWFFTNEESMRKDSFYDRFPATPEGEAEVIETVETDIRRQIRNNFDAAERLQDICIENKEELVETLVKRQMWYYTDTVRERFVRRRAECE